MKALQEHFAALRRRLRFVLMLRGLAWILALLLWAGFVIGLIDWSLHVPALVRGFLLTGLLTCAGIIAYRSIFQPLLATADDFGLAFQIESRFPELNDSLASAVQFLKDDKAAASSSASMRRQAIVRALQLAENLDFSVLIDRRGARMAGAVLAGAILFSSGLILVSYRSMQTAFWRLTEPFGGVEWPWQTALRIEARDLAARGAAFELKVFVRGVIPDQAVVAYSFDQMAPLEQVYEIRNGAFLARLEPMRVQAGFRFRVRANDAITPWHEVQVLSPPQIVALGGRASPQIRLHFPRYTALPDRDLPDGNSFIEAVAGTQVALRAATDRPIRRAWLDFPLDAMPKITSTAYLSAVGQENFRALTSLTAAQSGQWKTIKANLHEDRRLLSMSFSIQTTGTFALHVEDELGLSSTRLLEVRRLTDPAPTVLLEKPAPSRDVLSVLPDADISVRATASDPMFGLRSVVLWYRPNAMGHGQLPDGILSLYRHRAHEVVVPEVLDALLGLAQIFPEFCPNRQQVEIERKWPIAGLKLRAGDTLVLQACADDFDDLTVAKRPGRSHEVELHIVDRTSLEIALARAEAQIGQEVSRLHNQQQEALEKVKGIEERQRRNPAHHEADSVDDLLQAEQLQQQIRERIGNNREGLLADVERVLHSFRDNHLSAAGTPVRMSAVGAEVERLRRSELVQIEPQLTEARKQSEMELTKAETARALRNPLSEARRHQEEVVKTLQELLQLLQPWNRTSAVRSEAKEIAQEQGRLKRQTACLGREIPAGQKPAELSAVQNDELSRAAELQNKLAERTARLLQELEEMAHEPKPEDSSLSHSLGQAAWLGKKLDAVTRMQESERNLRENQLTQAQCKQEESVRAMREVVQAIEESKEGEVERLIKKMAEAECRLESLATAQESLGRKIRSAKLASDTLKGEMLRRLEPEQDHLMQKAQDLVRELSRLGAERASKALAQATTRMNRSGEDLAEPEALPRQEETLDRIDETRQELRQARRQAEIELRREKVAKLVEQIKGLKQRQDSLSAEGSRIHRRVLEQRRWSRSVKGSWRRLIEAQKELGEETQWLAAEKFANTKAFLRLLNGSAVVMKSAAERMQTTLVAATKPSDEIPPGRESAIDIGSEASSAAAITKSQQCASRRIDRLLEALQLDSASARFTGFANRDSGGAINKSGFGSYSVASILTALRALQQEINIQTHALSEASATKSANQGSKLKELQKEQHEVAEFFEEVATAMAAEGGGR
jgi:hypothetical protein